MRSGGDCRRELRGVAEDRVGDERVGPWSSHRCGGRMVLILWKPVQMDQPLEPVEAKSLRFDCTYMRPLRKEADGIVELSPIRTVNL